MFNLSSDLSRIPEPFEHFIMDDLVPEEEMRQLSLQLDTARAKVIAVDDPKHEKQYRMKMLSVVELDSLTDVYDDLSTDWRALVSQMAGPDFAQWLGTHTNINLQGLQRSIGIYSHREGDHLSPHKDKPTKAITCIIYVTPDWRPEYGGQFQLMEKTTDGLVLVKELNPRCGRLLAFPPTDRSWHAVSEITPEAASERVSVQVEFWNSVELAGSAYRAGGEREPR